MQMIENLEQLVFAEVCVLTPDRQRLASVRPRSQAMQARTPAAWIRVSTAQPDTSTAHRQTGAEPYAVAVAPEWQAKVEMLMACNCEWGCPCSFNAPPTYGDCAAALGYRVVEGPFGGVSLDGLRRGQVAGRSH